MATYPLPRVLEDIFNIENFLNTPYNTSYAQYAQITLSNTFQSINTFLSNVYIKATLYATNLNVSHINVTNSILGYNVSTFAGIKAPIQAQFDSITTGGNVTVQSTVSVAETLTVTAGTPASVENIGTNINANLKFSIPQGKAGDNAIQPSFSIGTVSSAETPSVTLSGSQTNPQLNFGLVQGIQGPIGNTGPQGIQGIQGPIGNTGPQGIQGIQGPIGNTGPQGIQGIQGPQGIEGPIGLTGANGKTPVFKVGTVTSSDTPNVLINYDPSDNALEFPIVSFQLQKGDTGATGPKGEKGSKGDTGEQGETGPKGDKGPSGADGNSTAANVASFFALSAVIAGTGAAVLAFLAGSEAISKFADKMTELGYRSLTTSHYLKQRHK